MNKSLKALERIKDFMKVNAKHWKQDVGMIEKELKALEIIKKLLIIDNDKQRIDIKNCVEMSDDEYDLLKEVLKND